MIKELRMYLCTFSFLRNLILMIICKDHHWILQLNTVYCRCGFHIIILEIFNYLSVYVFIYIYVEDILNLSIS